MNLQNGTLEHPIMGTSGNDTMKGTAADDFFYGAGGNDLLLGGDGNDYLRAGQVWTNGAWHAQASDDTLDGGNGDDTLEGGAGNDQLLGGSGYDELYGLEGDDTLDGGMGGGYLSGGDGNDTYIIRDLHTTISSKNQAGDKGIIYVDWYKTNQSVTNWTWAAGVQKLPYWIDALTYNNVQTLAQQTNNHVVKYNFVSIPPDQFDATDRNGFTPFTAAQKAQARKIMDYISSVINVTFVETTDTNSPFTISLANNYQSDSGGYANEIRSDGGSHILLNATSRVLDPTQDNGSELNRILIHEFGHALGLKHPFNHVDSVGNFAYGPYLPSSEDVRSVSVMSYENDQSGPIPMSYSPYDIAALQYIWGIPDKANAGDTTYKLDTTKAVMIFDGSGFDVIDWGAATRDVVLDLRPGYQSHVGLKTDLFNSPGQLTINFGTKIEMAEGGYGNDTLIANEFGSYLMGRDGNDTLNGGAGVDTAVFTGKHSDFKVQSANGVTLVTDKVSNQGTDTLNNIEHLLFDDAWVSLDENGIDGQAYRLYRAAFDRAPDAAGLGYWMRMMQKGMSLDAVASGFLNSPEFKTLYGDNLSNSQLLEQLYKNVLHRAPDAAGFDYWLKLADNGLPREVLLRNFSESPENHAALVGVMQTGFEYKPYMG